MSDAYTEDLSDFGYREIEMLRDLLDIWIKQGLPEDFEDDGVKPAFNTNSGFVFLTNSEYQVAMLNGDELESFYACPNCGHEGFLEEMEHGKDDKDCQEYLAGIKETVNA